MLIHIPPMFWQSLTYQPDSLVYQSDAVASFFKICE